MKNWLLLLFIAICNLLVAQDTISVVGFTKAKTKRVHTNLDSSKYDFTKQIRGIPLQTETRPETYQQNCIQLCDSNNFNLIANIKKENIQLINVCNPDFKNGYKQIFSLQYPLDAFVNLKILTFDTYGAKLQNNDNLDAITSITTFYIKGKLDDNYFQFDKLKAFQKLSNILIANYNETFFSYKNIEHSFIDTLIILDNIKKVNVNKTIELLKRVAAITTLKYCYIQFPKIKNRKIERINKVAQKRGIKCSISEINISPAILFDSVITCGE